MTDLNDIKAGKYQLVARSWDKITSKPSEPLDFIRYRRGDVVDLNVEDAKRLVAAGAVVPPGALEKSAVEQAKAVAEQAQIAYEAALAGLPDDVRAQVAPGTVSAAAGDPAGDASGGSAFDYARKADDVLAHVGTDQALIAKALEFEQARGDKARSTLVTDLQKLAASAS